MVIGIIGENCSGKSTLAGELSRRFDAEVVTGRDYLRMAKTESEAVSLFRARLSQAMHGGCLIYVISDREHIDLLPQGALRILVRTDLETIKQRFRARMHGNLPLPVEQMLERKHGMFDNEPCDWCYDGAAGDVSALCTELEQRMK